MKPPSLSQRFSAIKGEIKAYAPEGRENLGCFSGNLEAKNDELSQRRVKSTEIGILGS